MRDSYGNGEHWLTDVVKGAIAGAVGVWALDKVTWFMMNRENPETLREEYKARPDGLDPAHVIANRAAGALGKELLPKQPHAAGIGVHYALGIAPAMLYSVLRRRVCGLNAGRGAVYGLGLFVMQDEIANWVLGTSGPPGAYPWQAHTRGVVGHIALGVATDVTLDLLDRLD